MTRLGCLILILVGSVGSVCMVLIAAAGSVTP